MKKIAALTLAMLFCVAALVGCGGNINRDIGRQAVEIVDRYLDGNGTADLAHERILELYDDYVDELDNATAFGILQLRIALSAYAHSGTTEDFNTFVERRNSLADDVGLTPSARIRPN